MSFALSDELAQNTAALSMALSSLVALGEEQRRAAIEVNEARLQAIFDERQELMKTLAALFHHRQQWRDTVQQLPDVTTEKAHFLASLARDDAMLSEKAQQVQRTTQEAETALRSIVQDIGEQLQGQRRREDVMRAYHPSSPPPRFVDRVNVL
jgi:Rad3-related DNA helicase